MAHARAAAAAAARLARLPTAATLAFSARGGAARVCHAWAADGRVLVVGHGSHVTALRVGADGGIAAPSDGRVQVLSNSAEVLSVAVARVADAGGGDGAYAVAIGSTNGVSIQWLSVDPSGTETQLRPISLIARYRMSHVGLSPSGAIMVGAATDTHAGLWAVRSLRSGSFGALWYGTIADCITAASVSPCDRAAVFACMNGHIRVVAQSFAGAWADIAALAPAAASAPRFGTLVAWCPGGGACFAVTSGARGGGLRIYAACGGGGGAVGGSSDPPLLAELADGDSGSVGGLVTAGRELYVFDGVARRVRAYVWPSWTARLRCLAGFIAYAHADAGAAASVTLFAQPCSAHGVLSFELSVCAEWRGAGSGGSSIAPVRVVCPLPRASQWPGCGAATAAG